MDSEDITCFGKMLQTTFAYLQVKRRESCSPVLSSFYSDVTSSRTPKTGSVGLQEASGRVRLTVD